MVHLCRKTNEMKHLIYWTGITIMLFSCGTEMTTPGRLVPPTVAEDPALPSAFINGTHLHTEAFGSPDDPLLVVVHGGPGGDYRSLLGAKAFSEYGFYVVFYDQRGSGLSKREPGNQYTGKGSVQLFIDDLHALIAYYRRSESQEVFLLGHSWGAMLATGYINQYPSQVSGAILAEPGGFTWSQTSEYLSRSNKIRFFTEALNDAVFAEQVIAGRSEHEVLDYKAAFFSNYENAPGNVIGNRGHYPSWRSGAVAFQALIANAEQYGFDFTTNLQAFTHRVLFLYSENNKAYGAGWAATVAAPYPNARLEEVAGCGHEILYFGWDNFFPRALNYLNEMR